MSTLRKLFGPSKKEIWKQLCDQTGANYVEGGFWKGDKVQAAHGEWTITLDTYVVSTGKTTITYTRMRAPYVNPDNFSFTVYRRGIFTDIGKWMGMQDIEVGDPAFDEEFVIKGNSDEKVRKLFSNPRIRELIGVQPQIHFGVKDHEGLFSSNYPPGVDALYFRVVGVIRDVERLKSLFELFAETLEQLCIMGSAYEKAPGLKL